MIVLVFSGMFIAFRLGDLKDKKLNKLDIEFFLKNLNPNALKFFNTTWHTNQDGFSRNKEISFMDDKLVWVLDKFLSFLLDFIMALFWLFILKFHCIYYTKPL